MTLRYEVEVKLNDGKREAPPVEIVVRAFDQLGDILTEELANDYGEPFGPGTTMLVTRLD